MDLISEGVWSKTFLHYFIAENSGLELRTYKTFYKQIDRIFLSEPQSTATSKAK